MQMGVMSLPITFLRLMDGVLDSVPGAEPQSSLIGLRSTNPATHPFPCFFVIYYNNILWFSKSLIHCPLHCQLNR
jgi:hypothetical protein